MSKRILFVDDEIRGWYMQLYVEALKNAGFVVVSGASVDEAKSLMETMEKPDLAIIDIIMPPGDWFSGRETNHGFETGLVLAEEISEKWKDQAIVFLTNMVDQSVLGRAGRAKGGRGVFAKIDYSPQQLVRIVNSSLREDDQA